MARVTLNRLRRASEDSGSAVSKAEIESDDPGLPWQDYDEGVTLKNIGSLTFDQFLAGISPFLTEKVPEGGGKDKSNVPEIDRLLGRLANIHAWLIQLYAHSADRANSHLRLEGKTGETYAAWVRKKDALYEFARATELKWKACSRMISVAIGHEDEGTRDQVNYRPTVEQAFEGRRGTVKGWGGVSS